MGRDIDNFQERLTALHRQKETPGSKLERILDDIERIFQSSAVNGYEQIGDELIAYFEAGEDLKDACGECRELVSYLGPPHFHQDYPQSTEDAITRIVNRGPAYSEDDIHALRSDITDLVYRQFPNA